MNSDSERSLATYLMRNPHLLVLAIIIIMVGGYSALQSMPRLEDPVITNRNPLILTLVPGASAERVEAQVTEKIENALKEIPEIKDVDTTSRANISVVAIELADEITIETNKEIFSQIRDKLNDAQQEFPPEALEPIFDDKRGAVAFTLIVGFTWDGSTETNYSILNRQAENLADRLRNIPGTNIVRLYGQPEEQILVEVDHSKIVPLGMTIGDIATVLRRADVKVPAGALVGGKLNFLVEVEGELDSVTRVNAVPLITNPNGSVLRLGDVAHVTRSKVEPPQEIAMTDRQETLFVAAKVQENRRVDLWSARAKEEVEAFQATLGENVTLNMVFDQDQYTSARLGELAFNLFLGGVVVFAVIFFSMGWRASFIVGSALPLTASMTLFLVAMTGGKLHQMSIFGMIIALGLLIDNAIVMTDEVRKNMAEGAIPLDAVNKALKHLFIPLLSSTLTTILAFAPILLLPGNAGDFVGSIGGSVIIALSCSFLVGITIIATLAGRFGKVGNAEKRLPRWLNEGVQTGPIGYRFQRFLVEAYRRPLIAMGGTAVIPLIGFLLASTLGVQFFPRTDRNMFELRLWLPTSTNIRHTETVTRAVEDRIRQHEEIHRIHWVHGGSFPSVYYNLVMNKDNSSNYAQAIIEASDFKAVKRLIPLIQEDLDTYIPEAQVVVTQFAQGPPSEADVEFRITGPNVRLLQNLGEEVRLLLAEHPDILHTQVTMPRGEPKVWFKANENETNLAGFSLAQLAQQLQGNLQGFVGGTVLEDVESLPVRVRFADVNREDFADLRTTNFLSPTKPQTWVPMTALGELELRPASGGITRRNGERVNIIRGYSRNEALPIEVTQNVMDKLEASDFSLPGGYRLELGGDQENQSEAVGNLTIYLPILIVLTISILILSFRSVFLAGLLGLVAFLSVGVGLLATWTAGLPLSFNTILGSLGLVGLAFNSSIVVLAAVEALDKTAQHDPESLAKQVMRSSRHLISTTLTTIGSFVPLLIFVGGDFWPPLAIVLAGGVGGSTLLAMVFTPSAYRLIKRVQPRVESSPATA